MYTFTLLEEDTKARRTVCETWHMIRASHRKRTYRVTDLRYDMIVAVLSWYIILVGHNGPLVKPPKIIYNCGAQVGQGRLDTRTRRNGMINYFLDKRSSKAAEADLHGYA